MNKCVIDACPTINWQDEVLSHIESKDRVQLIKTCGTGAFSVYFCSIEALIPCRRPRPASSSGQEGRHGKSEMILQRGTKTIKGSRGGQCDGKAHINRAFYCILFGVDAVVRELDTGNELCLYL